MATATIATTITTAGSWDGAVVERTAAAGEAAVAPTTMTVTVPGYDGGKVGEAYAADASITAQAFDHDPTDCSATQYASGIDSAGNLTCSTPAGGSGASGPIPSFGGF